MISRAFSLVELLVVVATIGVLLAITLPALTAARQSASLTACLARIGAAGAAHARWSSDHDGLWVNPLPPGKLFAIGRTGATGATAITQVLSTVSSWGFFMDFELVDRGETGEGVTCPVVHESIGPGQDMESRGGAVRSYWYSAALVTDWRIWQEGNEAARLEPDKHRAWVRTALVRHPSRKAALFEWSDWHSGHRSRIDSMQLPSGTASNVAFADGHVERVRLSDVRPALRVTWPWSPFQANVPSGEPLPFSSSVNGYRGWDK